MARQTQYASDYSADAVKVILHSDTSVELDEASRAVLERRFPNTRPPSSVWICKYLLRGLISFTSSTFSTRDSQVSYYGEDRSIRYGRIYSIFADCLPQHSGSPSTPNDDTKHRVYILVERYTPLQPQDAAVDPFECHPLTGPTGYNLFRTVYSSFMEALDLIEVKDVVGHIAICRTSANDRHKYAEATIITAQVDQVSMQPEPTSTNYCTNLTCRAFSPDTLARSLYQESRSGATLACIPLGTLDKPRGRKTK